MLQRHILKSSQIRAARALLGWSQEQLATASNLSTATIRKLECGGISPREKTNALLYRTFESQGLEFIEPNGVRQRPDDIMVYKGSDGFAAFYDDVYDTAYESSSEIVIVAHSEEQFTSNLSGKALASHINRMIEIKDRIKVKCILTNEQKDLPATEYCEYRYISRHYVDSVPFYVYDNKYAIIVFEKDQSPKVTVISSSSVATAFRNQFASMWDKATPLNKLSTDNKKAKRKI